SGNAAPRPGRRCAGDCRRMLDEKLRVNRRHVIAQVYVDIICAKGKTLERTPPLSGRQHTTVGELISNFRLKVRIALEVQLNLFNGGVVSVGIGNRWERLLNRREQLTKCGSVERLDVRCSKSQRSIDRLPTHRELRPLCRAEVAVVFVTLGVVKLQTIGAREIP